MSIPPPLPVSPVPLLSAEQLQQLATARHAVVKIRRATAVATFDGWSIAIFAALSFACSLSSISGMLMGSAMGIIAFVELTGASRLRRLEPRATRMLAFNQVAFAALLIVYAIWSLCGELSGGVLHSTLVASDPSLVQLLGPFEKLARQIAIAVYGLLIVIALTVQGGMALYYFSRTRHVHAYLQHTPAWILQLQKTGVSL